MLLPLNLAMTPSEIHSTPVLPANFAWMACHFCPHTEGITGIPEELPAGAMLILTDREPCGGHSANLVAQQLQEAVNRLRCESVLLDFQRPWDAESGVMVKSIVGALLCPVAVPPEYAADLTCPVFLPPVPLHMPLSAYLRPWTGREIWLEAALCQEKITVTCAGTAVTPIYPTEALAGGFYDSNLLCHYRTAISGGSVTFTLFDTRDSLKAKLEFAHSCGVSRAVGLYQELGTVI